jgi:uracil-DNA glycosylase
MVAAELNSCLSYIAVSMAVVQNILFLCLGPTASNHARLAKLELDTCRPQWMDLDTNMHVFEAFISNHVDFV